MPTIETEPVAATPPPLAHAPAVFDSLLPVPKLKRMPIPVLFVVFQVPVVSPTMVIVLYSHVFADATVYVNGYVLVKSAFCKTPELVPVIDDLPKKIM